MSKALEALECIKELYNERAYAYDDKVMHKGKGWSEAIQHYDNIGRCLNTIKQALQRLEQIDNSNPSEALEKVNKVLKSCYEYEKKTGKNAIVHISKEPLIEIQQALIKAQEQEKLLKIIKEKDVNFEVFGAFETYEDYEIYYNNKFHLIENKLTQDEFDLFKRLVENEKDI